MLKVVQCLYVLLPFILFEMLITIDSVGLHPKITCVKYIYQSKYISRIVYYGNI